MPESYVRCMLAIESGESTGDVVEVVDKSCTSVRELIEDYPASLLAMGDDLWLDYLWLDAFDDFDYPEDSDLSPPGSQADDREEDKLWLTNHIRAAHSRRFGLLRWREERAWWRWRRGRPGNVLIKGHRPGRLEDKTWRAKRRPY